MHNKATWQQMEQIERATGRQIVRIETTDLDTMEEVRRTFRGSISITGSWCPPLFSFPFALPLFARVADAPSCDTQQMKKALK